MGKTKIAVVGEEPAVGADRVSARPEKKHGKKKSLKEEKGIRVPGLKGGERVVAVGGEAPPEEPVGADHRVSPPSTRVGATRGAPARKPKHRGKKYLAARAKVDPQKTYSPEEAAKLVRETSTTAFNGSIELHLVLGKDGLNTQALLPHLTGKKKRLEVASDETIKKLKEGKIDFDVLLATKEFMPKLVPFAKLLGPRGLLPNPKQGTLVEDPEKAKAAFAGNTVNLKSEKKAPLAHLVVARADQPEAEIAENVEAVISAVGPRNIKKAVLSSTMGPGIKVSI